MLTEIGPAVSFAWEPAEANVMERPPRNRQTDRLVRPALLAYAYLQVRTTPLGCRLVGSSSLDARTASHAGRRH